MGFINDIRKIISFLPKQRQTLMFSATFSDDIRALAKSMLQTPIEINTTPRNTTVKKVKQWIHPVDKKEKTELLKHLISQNNEQTLVFSRTKHGANKLVTKLQAIGISVAAIHGNKSQGARTKALAQFKDGTLQVLVATDIAARGIDIHQLPVVINVDLPNVAEDYVHRIGRTGRAGAKGSAISLVSADEYDSLCAIESLIQQHLDREILADYYPNHKLPDSRPLRALKAKKPKKPKQDFDRKSNNSVPHPEKKRSRAPSNKPKSNTLQLKTRPK
jgi:ATP-dependent RNA helicase RhlE